MEAIIFIQVPYVLSAEVAIGRRLKCFKNDNIILRIVYWYYRAVVDHLKPELRIVYITFYFE